jgi:hypothetical protein
MRRMIKDSSDLSPLKADKALAKAIRLSDLNDFHIAASKRVIDDITRLKVEKLRLLHDDPPRQS